MFFLNFLLIAGAKKQGDILMAKCKVSAKKKCYEVHLILEEIKFNEF